MARHELLPSWYSSPNISLPRGPSDMSPPAVPPVHCAQPHWLSYCYSYFWSTRGAFALTMPLPGTLFSTCPLG